MIAMNTIVSTRHFIRERSSPRGGWPAFGNALLGLLVLGLFIAIFIAIVLLRIAHMNG